MYLKTIELNGFKSFPDKTVLDFTGGVTTIVGPNGSGKSNISDAIRWVLGESRAKSLRGGNMQDVIFSGTARRKPMNYAEVSVTIDNSDHALQIDFDEVMVTRRVYRSGEGEYFINKSPCRMKDINELFMDTGLGRDGYSIVGQGKIDEIISGKPQERRNFFEEAAGISKYRHKKDEAERKLNQTNDNLLRLNDILSELEQRLPGLEKSSKKAATYLALKDELRILEIRYWCSYIKKYREMLSELDAKNQKLTLDMNVATKRIEDLDQAALKLSQKRREADLLTEEFHKKEKDYEYNIAAFENQITLYQVEIERNIRDIERLHNEKETDKMRLTRYEALISDREDKINQLKENRQNIESEMETFSHLQKEIDGLYQDVTDLQNHLEENRKKRSELTVERNTKQGKVMYLSEMEKNYEGYQKSVKEIFSASKNGLLPDVTLHGTLADIIKADKKTALAFDAVLGNSLQNIVVEDEGDAKQAINYLKKHELGRVTFLPVKTVKERDYNFGEALRENGVVGKATELVSYQDKFKGVVSGLLGKTLVVDNYQAAAHISGKYQHSFRIVTLTGEVFNAGGSIVGGQILKSAGFLSKSANIAELKNEIKQIDKTLLKMVQEETDLTYSIDSKKLQAETLSEGLTELNQKKAYLTFIEQGIRDEIEHQKTVLTEKEEYESALRHKNHEADNLIQRNEALTEDIAFKQEQIQQEEQYLKNTIAELEGIRLQKESIDETFIAQQDAQKQARDALLVLEQELAKLTVKTEKIQNDIEVYTENLWEQYELTYSQGLELVSTEEGESENERKKISELKSKIKSLGDVNLSSVEEYREVNERYTFMKKQEEDLKNAKEELETLISDMLSIMKTDFTTQFHLIHENFKETFQALFNGGNASLKLTEPDNVLESGIEIIVQPPGKKLESISLLSGGEKAFTAIALLFSVLSLKPLPFCVFDEIEAALDEVNVYRFAEYIKSYKNKTQFILVSHRRGTMENADNLYGVTMQEKGVTKLVSLKMKDVIMEN
ncbi:MAG: chromosome segregation protein SMC [Ruminococcaceae bacterium]|nr:chromosome segregation protein SMC [Oscillospiraceae bacterium]